MPISFRRYKQKATKFINDNYSNEMNHDLKMYLDMPEFRPFFDQSVERINAGRDKDEIKSTIRHLAQSTIDTAFEVAEERRGGGGASSKASSSDNESLSHSTTDELQPQDVNLFKGNGIHHHYHYFFH